MIRTGIYPGTFDPITKGHLDIVERATKLCDRLVIGVAPSHAKNPTFSLEERVAIIKEETGKFTGRAEITVRPYENLLMHFAEQVGASMIIRGLRAVADFEFEFQMTAMNQQLDRNVDTVFLMADPRHQAIASRLVKEIATLGGDVSPFVSAGVKERLMAKVAAR
jgi:pantetheine-phosphate adenylyltransferase